MKTFERAAHVMRGGVILAALAGVAACSSSGGGGGGGGGAGAGGGGGGSSATGLSATEYQALFDSYQTPSLGNAPTSDMPVTGSGTYEGTVQVDVRDPAGADAGAFLGDVALEVQFGAPSGPATTRPMPTGGSVTERNGTTPITGTVTNVRGTLSDGTEVTSDVEFSTAHAAAQAAGGGILTTQESVVDTGIAGVPTVETRTGALTVPMGATITDANAGGLDARGTALLTLGGVMMGPEAAASVGTATLNIDDPALPGITDVSGSGTYVVEKQ
ncbi:hypothetical protein [Roseivivax isoporae]|nr:hypothetical protein [Roseivivax isoporae]